MKKFVDETDSGKEPAIKTGNYIPEDAINLAFYTTKEVSPENNISIIDLSGLIPENVSQEPSSSKIMYSNELGILEDEFGNPYVETDDIYVSDMFVNNQAVSESYSIEDLNKENYVNNYYISRFFTLLKTTSYIDFNIESYVDQAFVPSSVKVLDKNGNLYADEQTGRLKYRISFEAFVTSSSYKQKEIPNKIIVYIEDINPGTLTLVYDKVEVDSTGNWSKQILQYKETINYIPLYSKVQEESEVIDKISYDRKVFSVKRNTKRSNINNTLASAEERFITVNRRAIDDNRLFEIFNWRLVAAVKSSVNLSEIDNGYSVSDDSQARKNVNAGVLYSSSAGKDLSKISPYALANLLNSSFNLANYSISNPHSENQNINSADYWLVDIDTINENTILDYDFLICDLHWKLTDSHSKKINSFVDNAGTIVLDCSNAPLDGLVFLNPYLQMTQADYSIVSSGNFSYSSDSLYLRSSLNNAFDITASEFATDCGIFGLAKNVAGTYKRYNYFSNNNLSSVLSVNSKKIFTSIRKTINTDRLISGNIIVSTTGFLKYCNDIYSGSSNIPTANNGTTNISSGLTTVFSNFVEGPYKFLYNCMTVGLNDKTESRRRSYDLKSSVHVFSSPWRTNWILGEEALFEDEKDVYYKNTVVNGSQKYVREIIPNPKLRYLDEISTLNASASSLFYDQNENNIDLYIEYTNENVIWTNSINATTSEKNTLSSTYNLVKISNKTISCDVYTDKQSPKFTIPFGLGPYVVKDKFLASKSAGASNSPVATVSSTSYARNYPFNFIVNHSSTSGNDKPKIVDATIDVVANVDFVQSHTFETFKSISYIETEPIEATATSGAVVEAAVSDFESSQSGDLRFNKQGPLGISDVYNAYAYTYDIDNGNTWDEYFQGKGQSDYIKYIQASITVAGYKTSIDGSFGADTTKKLKEFQDSKNINQDGIVDSRTKNYLANVWKDASEKTITTYQKNHPSIKKYIDAALLSVNAVNGLSSGTGFRLINFTGISADRDPDKLKLWIGFKLPDGFERINSITLSGEDFGTKKSSPLYKGFKILDYKIGDSYNFNRNNRSASSSYVGKNSTYTINLPAPEASVGKYVSILLEGSSLGGAFGTTAEGIQISNISCSAKAKGGTTSAGVKYTARTKYVSNGFVTNTKNVTGTVEMSIPREKISFNENTLTVDAQTLKTYGVLKSIFTYAIAGDDFTDSKINYSNLSLQLNNQSYIPDSSRVKEVINISNPVATTISVSSASIRSGSVKESGTSLTQDNSLVLLTRSGNNITTSCNSSVYQSSTTYTSTQNITGYSLVNPDRSVVTSGKNSVNYFDGTMLLCQQNGSPIGVSLNNVSTQVSADTDVYYSDIKLTNTLPEQSGLQYGFYDISSKQFLGKSISYTKYQQVGPSNVYIGVYAYDYDGNLDTLTDHTGSSNGDIFTPVSIPIKMAYPVYKVSFNRKNKIQISGIPSKLQKTEPWPIYFTSGSFAKQVSIALTRPKGWVSKYNNQTLEAKYDTNNLDGVAWSKVFGRNYYDVINEKPIINSPRSITLRRTPVVTVHNASNNLVTYSGQFRQIVKIYTRTTVNSPWVEVPYSKIKDINCKTGLIEFDSSIISSNENLTKVDYTIEYSSIGVIGVNGIEIPTNPFLNKDSIKINKPLYIYLKPKQILKYSSIETSEISIQPVVKIPVEEYVPESIVNFTYNNNIFNKNDISAYDPFALLIGVIYVTNSFNNDNFNFNDLRSKGGGIASNITTNQAISSISQSVSYWDVYPALGEAYPKAGYVIIRIPSLVKKNFVNPDEVYEIIRRNLTAGVVFELQDMNGNDWSSSVTTSS